MYDNNWVAFFLIVLALIWLTREARLRLSGGQQMLLGAVVTGAHLI